jgi:serine phosphatase RsbU (regulator of sigma subunit)
MFKKYLVLCSFLLFAIGLFGQVDSVLYKKTESNIKRAFDLLYLDLDSAFIYANNALQYAKSIKDEELEVNALRVVAMVYYSHTKYDSAFYYYNLAENKFTSAMDSSLIVSIIANKANIYAETHQIEKALLIYQEVKEYYENTKDILNVGKITATIANLLMYTENFKEAMIHFDEAQNYFKQAEFEIGIGITYQNKALIYSEFDQYDSAKHFTYKAADIYRKIGSSNLLFECYGNLADFYTAEDQLDSAAFYLDEAITGFENGGTARDLSVSYLRKAYLSDNIGNKREAIRFINKAHKLAHDHSFHRILIDVYSFAHSLYKKTGNVNKALENLENYRALSDSLHEVDLASHETELIAEYSIAKREKEIELLKTQDNLKAALIRKQQNAMLAIGLLAIIIGIITIGVLRRLRTKRLANAILSEKNEEINAQNEEIRAQSEEIIKQNDLLVHQKQELTDSINYARFIQQSIFTAQVDSSIEYFRYNKPKDIVSGDFFWSDKTENYQYFAVADCTGHGVPGAFMSLLGFTFLNQVFNQQTEPPVEQMLEVLRFNIKKALNQSSNIENSKDGLDLALIRINLKTRHLEFAGAYRPVWIFDENGFNELKGDRQPIGYYPKEKPFTKQSYALKDNAKIYLFTDGLTDQLNDDETQKLKVKGFYELIERIKDLPISDQKESVSKFYQTYVGRAQQIDDILVAGISL